MRTLITFITRLLSRWSRQEEAALWQMTNRKTVGQRIAGYSKSEKVEAKFFLMAFAPFVVVMVWDGLGWERGLFWHAWFWLSAAWAVFVVAIGFAAIWRALRRSMRRDQ